MEEIRNKTEKHVDIAIECNIIFLGKYFVNRILCVNKFLYHWSSSLQNRNEHLPLQECLL